MSDPQKEFASQLRFPHGEGSKEVTAFMARANGEMYDFALQLFRLLPNDRILEVGPANGFFLKKFFDLQSDLFYSGVDLSTDMVREACALNLKWIESGKASFEEGSVENLPFKNSTFEHLVTVNTLYFWPDVQKGINEILRVLKPGGDFSIAIRSAESMKQLPFANYGFNLFTESDLTQILRSPELKTFSVHSHREKIILPDGQHAELVDLCAFGVKA